MRKDDFPIFRKHPSLIYLDTPATAQKPRVVIEAMRKFLSTSNAPVHRSLYPLGESATDALEKVRAQTAAFLGAEDPSEVIFTRNTTEAINLVAATWGRVHVRRGDTILVSRMEHHSNFVPWQMLAQEKGATLRIVSLTEDGRLDLSDLRRKLTKRVRIVAITYVSNVLGTVNPIEKIARIIRASYPLSHIPYPIFIVDAAQAAPHLPIRVRTLGCDFLAFSGHKLYGPTGVGVLWGRRSLLELMPPFLTGGHMVLEVTEKRTVFNDIPHKFEAGTPDVGGVIGLGAAIEYIEKIGWERIVAHERAIMAYALRRFSQNSIRKFISLYGPLSPAHRVGAIPFTVKGLHPHDVATLLAEEGIAVRAGHHCAMPLHEALGIPASVRVSFGIYTDRNDIDALFRALRNRVFPYAS